MTMVKYTNLRKTQIEIIESGDFDNIFSIIQIS